MEACERVFPKEKMIKDGKALSKYLTAITDHIAYYNCKNSSIEIIIHDSASFITRHRMNVINTSCINRLSELCKSQQFDEVKVMLRTTRIDVRIDSDLTYPQPRPEVCCSIYHGVA